MRPFISSFDIINVVVPEVANPVSAADAAVVNPNGINTILANSVGTLVINSNQTSINGSRSLPWNPPDCIILDH